MLILQVVYPFSALVAPSIFLVSVFALDWVDKVNFDIVTMIFALIMVLYPFVSACFGVYFIACYRKYVIRLITKCFRCNSSVVKVDIQH